MPTVPTTPLDSGQLGDLYGEYAKPRLVRLLKTLKLDQVYHRAEGDRLFYRDDRDPPGTERAVIDFLGGFGSTLLGHHHPDVDAELRAYLDERGPAHAQASIRAYSGLLGKEINDCVLADEPSAPGYYLHLASTGTETVEAALKHALMEYRNRRDRLVFAIRSAHAKVRDQAALAPQARALEEYRRRVEAAGPVIVALEGSYHGKTAASLQVTSNPAFREMYPTSAFESSFVDAWSRDSYAGLIAEREIPSPTPLVPSWNRIAAVIYEPIQGEGGIEALPAEFFGWLDGPVKARGIPRIADEIQSGLYRTGKFLAGSHFGGMPDYFLLGKSLGGGFAKIGALLVAKERFQEDFSLLHSSTFAEDEPSSRIALRTLRALRDLRPTIAARADAFERRFQDGIRAIQKDHPGFLRDVRGRGFFQGIEFDFTGFSAPIPNLLKMIHDSGFASYLVMSALLNQFGLRVAVTLSRLDVIRIEPSALISDADVDAFLAGMRTVCDWIRDRKMLRMTKHLWREEFTDEQLETVSPPVRRLRPEEFAGLRQVGFATHLIDLDHLFIIDPMFKHLSREERKRFVRKYTELEDPFCYHEQIVRGKNGERVVLRLLGTLRPTGFFERSLRERDFQGIEVVREIARAARERGSELLGLGQYTSIVTENGYLLDDAGYPITTGNSLTAGLSYLALKKALAQKGSSLADVRVGIVGAAGNICNVIAQLLADEAKEMTLITRDDPDSMARMAEAAKRIFANAKIDPSRIKLSSRIEDLADCQAVLVGTNTAKQIITPEILAKDATLVDLSVPSNVDPRVLAERPDVRCIQGGLARMPVEQVLETHCMPLPPGQIYACLAETLTLGLSDRRESFSFGPLSKPKVLEILGLAEHVGVSLGSLIPVQTRRLDG